MLEKKLRDCKEIINEVSRRKVNRQKNVEIVKNKTRFIEAYSKYLRPSLESYVALKGFQELHFSEEVTQELKKCVESAKEVLTHKEGVTSDRFFIDTKNVYDKLKLEWEKFIASSRDGIIDTLIILQSVCDNGTEISRLIIAMRKATEWPMNVNTMQEYQEKKQKAEEFLQKMSFDEEIKTFLTKIKNKQATLNDLTDPILTWIRKENLSDNIILSVKAKSYG